MSEPSVSIDAVGWDRADRNLRAARVRFANALVTEDWQGVGLLCREALISLAQAAFDPTRHAPVDGQMPSPVDAIRLLDGVIARELQGSSNDEVRRYVKAAMALALALQHRRTAQRQDAALCLEATASISNAMRLICGIENVEPSAETHEPTDGEEREAMSVLIAIEIARNPLFSYLGVESPSVGFDNAFVSMTTLVGEASVMVRVERPRWWHPASAEAAASLTGDLIIRLIAKMPPIREIKAVSVR